MFYLPSCSFSHLSAFGYFCSLVNRGELFLVSINIFISIPGDFRHGHVEENCFFLGPDVNSETIRKKLQAFQCLLEVLIVVGLVVQLYLWALAYIWGWVCSYEVLFWSEETILLVLLGFVLCVVRHSEVNQGEWNNLLYLFVFLFHWFYIFNLQN